MLETGLLILFLCNLPTKDTSCRFYTRHDSLNTRFVGNWPFGYSYRVALDTIRKIAYVSSGGGVFVVDISNPSASVKIGEIRTRGTVGFLKLQDSILYISNGWDRDIALWNVATPSRPVKVANIPLTMPTLFIRQNYLYGIDQDSFRIFDISNPTQPVQLSSIGPYHRVGFLTVADSFAFISFESNTNRSDTGLCIINISNPATPYEVGRWDRLNVTGLAIANNLAFCATDSGLFVLDISNPAEPYCVGSCTEFIPQLIEVRNNYAYTDRDGGGLVITDVSNPANPFVVSTLRPGRTYGTEDLVLMDSFALLVDWSPTGLWIVNISNPLAPFEAGDYQVPGWAGWVEIAGEYAYLCDWDYGLTVLNIANPAEPYEVSKFAAEWGVDHIVLRDTIGYLCEFANGLRILNLSNPQSPVEIGFCSTPGATHACAVKGSCAYVADGLNGLRVIDVSNPQAPYEIGYYDTPGYARFVDVGDSFAYVADEAGGLRIISISNPAAPYEVGSVLLSNYPVVLKVKDSFAYVGGYYGDMVIVNVKDPRHPYPVGRYQTVGPCWGIDIAYPYAYVSDWFVWLHIVDISDPSNPVEVGYHWAPNSPYGLKYVPPYVYVTTGLCGLQVYESFLVGIQEAGNQSAFCGLTLYPSPAKSYFQLSGQTGLKAVRLYDIAGKLVRVYQPVNAGSRFSLERIPAGVYLVKLQTPDREITRKLVVR